MDFDSSVHFDSGMPTDTEPSPNVDLSMNPDTEASPIVDPGINVDTEPSSNIDPGMNADSVSAEHMVAEPFVEVHCVNCGTDVTQRRRHRLELVEVNSVITRWMAPRLVEDGDLICHSCWTVALMERRNDSAGASTSSGHRRHVCINCGCSLLRTRSHQLRTDTERNISIRNRIIEWIQPQQLRGSDQICHACWLRCDRAQPAAEPTSQQTIHLPHLKRASGSQQHCFYPECGSSERLIVPKWLRLKLFADCKFYVPNTCRICRFHLENDNWDVLDNIPQPIHSFNVSYIEDFASFVNERPLLLDFCNLDGMPNETVNYWIGLSKNQFKQLCLELPRLVKHKNGQLALAAYLLKLRTGESDERISTLLNIPRTTLMRLLNNARKILSEDFVPRNLGINHITREEIKRRNLLIPNGLFGGENSNPIVIMDGTYIYIQKSSNYLYQKDTYSLHKYRNLIKPFMIVCSDGYIVDVLGPYPATSSDATIITHEFGDESKPLRQYFQPGDVFILDRGFRDCVPLLERCNYSVHTPLCMEAGETQLSTLAANKSRRVTICRWVVEAVNGIFKYSYKLLRHEFFNKASKHAMTDIRIAAALINKFHQRIRDRADAGEILQIINFNLYRNNELADFVSNNNLNRRSAQFLNLNVNINNVSFPRLDYTDLILIACGTYQLKQAKSYYGEHIRNDGSYIIEVCREVANNLLEGFPSAENSRLLRAKIKSRHIGKKIYFVYILYLNNNEGRQSIQQYCCNCIVGRRTVGCCAHIMTVIWFLSWARYQERINPPAQFLDNVLLSYDE